MRSVVPSPSEVVMLARLTRDLPRFLRAPIAPEQAAAIVRRRLQTRAERFLAFAERAIYRQPGSPYLRLLRAAGCEPGDLRALVHREGLDEALRTLADRGVYVGFEEFKGRRDIVRGSTRFAVTQADFRNPGLAPHFERRTGGTRSGGVPVYISLRFVADQAANHLVALGANGLAGAEHVVWLTAPIFHMLRYARLGPPPLAWFYPVTPLPRKVRAGGRYLQLYSRLLGRPLPGPIGCGLGDAPRLARWLAARCRANQPLAVTAYASAAVRSALAAHEQGVSLAGVSFIALGEPFTAGKERALEAAGARATAYYGSTETGTIGYRCGRPLVADDMHFFADNYALGVRARPLGAADPPVEALLLTTLLESAPEVWLNVENGDHATLEQRACDCAMGALGLELHLSEIRSHEKLTGEGMTFARTRLVPLLEETLPARFGGAATDYQAVEEEGDGGILRLSLLVHPRVGPLEEAELRRAFLAELAGDGPLEGYMARVWERAGTVRVRREPPRATAAGKVLPFHVARQAHGR